MVAKAAAAPSDKPEEEKEQELAKPTPEPAKPEKKPAETAPKDTEPQGPKEEEKKAAAPSTQINLKRNPAAQPPVGEVKLRAEPAPIKSEVVSLGKATEPAAA